MNAKRSRMLMLGAICAILPGCIAVAQTEAQVQQVMKSQVIKTVGENDVVTVMAREGQGSTFTFMKTEMGFESKVVKGAPFLADTITEFTQTLSNGQKIYRKSAATLARDSEGRTRREQTIDAIGPFAGTPRQTVFINDPVAGVNYSLNPESRVATKMNISEGWHVTAQGEANVVAHAEAGLVTSQVTANQITAQKTVTIESAKAGAGQVFTTTSISPSLSIRNESLGTMTLEGLTVEGTRTIETIPAGTIGNDAPIDIVSERWYSPELGIMVKTTHNDPMTGENTYQVTNIRKVEPPALLFQVPTDYTVKEGEFKIQIQNIKK